MRDDLLERLVRDFVFRGQDQLVEQEQPQLRVRAVLALHLLEQLGDRFALLDQAQLVPAVHDFGVGVDQFLAGLNLLVVGEVDLLHLGPQELDVAVADVVERVHVLGLLAHGEAHLEHVDAHAEAVGHLEHVAGVLLLEHRGLLLDQPREVDEQVLDGQVHTQAAERVEHDRVLGVLALPRVLDQVLHRRDHVRLALVVLERVVLLVLVVDVDAV